MLIQMDVTSPIFRPNQNAAINMGSKKSSR